MADLVDDYTGRLYRLLPRGPIWPQESREGSVWDALMMALAEELARVHDVSDEWRYDFFPDTCTQQLSSWERILSLPDCEEDLGDDDTRRSRIVAKLRARGPCTVAALTTLVRTFHASNEIIEDGGAHMFRVGTDAMGDTLGGDLWADTLTVQVYGGVANPLLECAVEHFVPVHTYVMYEVV